jgi:hypothetical protein
MKETGSKKGFIRVQKIVFSAASTAQQNHSYLMKEEQKRSPST